MWTSNPERAIEILEATRAHEPSCGNANGTVTEMLYAAYLNLAEQKVDRGEFDQALVQYDKALGVSPSRSEASDRRRLAAGYRDGMIAKGQSDTDRAVSLLAEVVKSDPQYAGGNALAALFDARLERASRLASTGQIQEAIQEADRAAELRPDDQRAKALQEQLRVRSTPPTIRPSPAPAPTLVPPPSTGSGPQFEIGRSVEGRPLQITRVGTGPIGVLLVGNLHGAWAPMAYQTALDVTTYFQNNPNAVPSAISAYFIPTINPDGIANGMSLVPGAPGNGSAGDVALARWAFNADRVDLSRNFSANWSPRPCGGERYRLYFGATDTDRCQAGAGGPRPFSEPETDELTNFILQPRYNIRMVLSYAENSIPTVTIRDGGGGASEPLAYDLSRLLGIPYQAKYRYPLTGQFQDWIDSKGLVGADIEVQYRRNEASKQIPAFQMAMRSALANL